MTKSVASVERLNALSSICKAIKIQSGNASLVEKDLLLPLASGKKVAEWTLQFSTAYWTRLFSNDSIFRTAMSKRSFVQFKAILIEYRKTGAVIENDLSYRELKQIVVFYNTALFTELSKRDQAGLLDCVSEKYTAQINAKTAKKTAEVEAIEEAADQAKRVEQSGIEKAAIAAERQRRNSLTVEVRLAEDLSKITYAEKMTLLGQLLGDLTPSDHNSLINSSLNSLTDSQILVHVISRGDSLVNQIVNQIVATTATPATKRAPRVKTA